MRSIRIRRLGSWSVALLHSVGILTATACLSLSFGSNICFSRSFQDERGAASTHGALSQNSTGFVPLRDVRWTADSFWGERLHRCLNGTMQTMDRLMYGTERSHFIENFLIAAGQKPGRHRGPAWNDGDTYKWLEAKIALMAQVDDSAIARSIETEIEQVIEILSSAQREDGYLHTPVLIANQSGDLQTQPFGDPGEFEMYNFGHLMTAACSHQQITGKESLLRIARKAADFLDRQFSIPDKTVARHAICPAHYMGVIDLYRSTGEDRYLKLGKRWLAMRDLVVGGDDNQDRIPLRSQREAVGHAVRANYLYAGVADLCLEEADSELTNMLRACWQSVHDKKIYITGGCGALYDGASPDGSGQQKTITRTHQAYGRNYQLPNSTAHNETCAAVGNILWNFRMWQLFGECQYIDALENSLYNAVLAGVSLDGSRFFYTNTLRQLHQMPTDLRWSRERQEWISCYCCPPNVARTVASVARYAYSVSEYSTTVLLYGSNELHTTLQDRSSLTIKQESEYPWNGRIHLAIPRAPSRPYTLRLRIPGWCKSASLRLNGSEWDEKVRGGMFVEIKREWKPDDRVELDLDFSPTIVSANPLVEECVGQVAVKRGPLIYCVESHDIPQEATIHAVHLKVSNPWTVVPGDGVLRGIRLLQGKVLMDESIPASPTNLYKEFQQPIFQQAEIKMIPYFAWGNRGTSEMSVWNRVQP